MFLIVRTDANNEPYCEESHKLEADMLEAISEASEVMADVLCVISVGIEEGCKRIDRDELEAMLACHMQQVADERETDAWHSSSHHFI